MQVKKRKDSKDKKKKKSKQTGRMSDGREENI